MAGMLLPAWAILLHFHSPYEIMSLSDLAKTQLITTIDYHANRRRFFPAGLSGSEKPCDIKAYRY